MIKYIAIMKVDDPDLLSEWCSYHTTRYFKSSIETDKTVLENWLKNEISKYPDSTVNNVGIGAKHIITTTIIAFDTEKSDNVESFLKHFISF